MNVHEEQGADYIRQLLKALPQNLTPLERIILCSDGMVQTHLSSIFRIPVRVEVLSQQQSFHGEEIIIRKVRLVAEYSPERQITACRAESVIPVASNAPAFIDAIKEKKLGIGQILKSEKHIFERQLLGLYADEYEISRNYSIKGENLYVSITEVFPRNALVKAGRWCEKG